MMPVVAEWLKKMRDDQLAPLLNCYLVGYLLTVQSILYIGESLEEGQMILSRIHRHTSQRDREAVGATPIFRADDWKVWQKDSVGYPVLI